MASAEQRARFQAELERGTKLAQAEKPKPASKRRKGLKQGGPLPEKSEKKKLTDKIHNAYRDAFIFLARRYDDLNCWECGIPCKPSQLDLHHDTRRGQGGKHEARNYLLACNKTSANGPNNCHDRLDGNDLRFTKKEAS